jgi:SPP1 family phage portal protein
MYQINLTGDRLTGEQLTGAISAHAHRSGRFDLLREYYLGQNYAILNRKLVEDGPDNKIAVPIAKRIIKTVAGYMFKPGLIQIIGDGLDAIRRVLQLNDEQSKTSRLGRYMSIFGEAIELHFTDAQANPVFAVPDPAEIMAIYDYQIEPEIVAAIRMVKIEGQTKIEVWYSGFVDYLTYKDGRAELYETAEHLYQTVPVVVYRNNDDGLGDFESQIKLIDAYDVLISDSMNELDRFAHAYLILKQISMDTETAAEVKRKRIFEIFEGAEISFLTKDINDTFFENLKKTIKDLIHEMTQVPNLADEKFAGNQSGVAIRYKLADFENLCSEKEIGFRSGLVQRIELISRILNIADATQATDFDIVFNRNLPANLLEIADVMTKLSTVVSKRTILEQIPFVKNPDNELERIAKEEAEKVAAMDVYTSPKINGFTDPADQADQGDQADTSEAIA